MGQQKDGRVTKHADGVVYTVWVLWLIGMSLTSIGAATLKRRKQIAGIIARSPYTNRSAMTDEERQQAIDELIAVRHCENDGAAMDGGILDRIPLTIIPLRDRQRKIRRN